MRFNVKDFNRRDARSGRNGRISRWRQNIGVLLQVRDGKRGSGKRNFFTKRRRNNDY